MDALSMLRRDHREIRKLLAAIGATTDRAIRTRTRLLAELKTRLTAHEKIEEEIFYPALRDHPKATDLVLEGYVEHDVVDRLFRELDGLPVGDQAWKPTAKVMTESLTHHIEEEEREMFEQARRIFDSADLQELGRRMAERRADVLAELSRPGQA